MNFPVSPIFKSLNFNFGVNFINPAVLGIGSPCGSCVGKSKNYPTGLLIFEIVCAPTVQLYRELHPI